MLVIAITILINTFIINRKPRNGKNTRDSKMSTKCVRFMDAAGYDSKYGGMKIMRESESESEDSGGEWDREIKVLTVSEQMRYKGKTLGKHKTDSFEIAKILYGKFVVESEAIDMATRYSELYMGKQPAMITDLKLIFGEGPVQQVVEDLSGFKEGAVILIPKDDTSWLDTRHERYREINKSLHFADDSTRVNGGKLLKKAFADEFVQCADFQMASRIQKALVSCGFVESRIIGEKIWFGDNNIHVYSLDIRNKIALKTLLRWNSWLFFEKAVAEFTTLANPTEWDSLIGRIWRNKFGNAARFEE